ncbi:DUF1654 domain-containing protein [Azotobacter chroococcum]|uniref:DUF1654 domain-containing protein n=2 Tax=Azotobacter chroococcum TaxID=353 RepID=A0A0C4WM73_9GAMM|nr:DUF1654 domain-containing protein [Azotobacter chroococcum]AJE21469.1 Hypothetical protein Achr_20180 [Azotobacter chroococcum NCIMB 8003]QQE86944.1 DUF1654 domain-containing protein [Azotobacter chroococcum]TKD40561.1 DUF1654 domain-containing protein [Azotobacter chroococcum]
MAKAKRKAQQQPQELTPLERLGLRVSSMINTPKAQLERQVTIHRLATDPDDTWDEVMELLAETDGLEMAFSDDGSVTLKWERQTDDDAPADDREFEMVDGGEAQF